MILDLMNSFCTTEWKEEKELDVYEVLSIPILDGLSHKFTHEEI